MKNLLLSIFFLSSFQFAIANKVLVTSSSDDVSNPTFGMLRYFIYNSSNGDTIMFNVPNVNLLTKIDIITSVVIDGGKEMVTIDGGYNDQLFNVIAYNSSTTISIKNLKLINGKIISDNAWGGAMKVITGDVSGGKAIVENCIFYNNEAFAFHDGQGGALYSKGLAGVFINCSFFNNKLSGTADLQEGGAVMAWGGTFINCVFSGNQAKNVGGVYAHPDAQFFNCTFAGNRATASNSVGGIQSDKAYFENCIAFNNYANSTSKNINAINFSSIKNCAIESTNALVGLNGNIGLNTSPFRGGSDDDSLSLVQGSPCIDAGTSDLLAWPTDILGNKRIAGAKIDMGAYEYGSAPIAAGIFTSVVQKEPVLYPNPSKGTVYLNQEILQNGIFSIEVFDLLGKLILVQNDMDESCMLLIEEQGIFQVKIRSNNTVYFQKIVIE
ncbi:choice-of-anchor Q domain-containing protein [Sporocytophaga myxococcoides]|uniref:choice-of-anchor Q domain-containing protein n=1 Tax=Sporocytophaga myxococcoides TaxID=153721 RepID=UPI00041692EA|nr:choice-of-anchor Q domain-containing protein [Sporocytophaga myxococcoides]